MQKHRINKREENPDEYRCQIKKQVQKHRINKRDKMNKEGRLHEFKIATMHGPIFICVCCHQLMFKTNVQLYENSKASIEKSILEQSIPAEMAITNIVMNTNNTVLNSEKLGDYYVCKTCIRHMSNGKMPPTSVMNHLQLKETEQERINLTELEGNLIAKNIIFQKIFQLYPSGWTALKDKIVNVPIEESAIYNTLEKLPRTPKEAGLIGVALKRKKVYKNTHQNQLIDPEKIYRMLDMLKVKGNPYYQFYENKTNYEEKCREADPKGYELLYPDEQDDILEELEKVEAADMNENVSDELYVEDTEEKESGEEIEEKNYIENDPVQKYQFTGYNESFVMTHKYPETVAQQNQITIAPGEGQIPKNVLQDENWDLKAFPYLNNLDGSNGMNADREVKLTHQKFFLNRVFNKDKRFARSAPYLYAALAYLELKQINTNINLVGTRGKQVKEGNIKSYELEGGYQVLEGIRNTPKYWKTAKYEFLAKLDNLGPFQFFFTLSCADMRWPENYAAILMEEGHTVRIEIQENKTYVWIIKDDGSPEQSLEDYMSENKKDSKSKMIQGNVITATRFFQHRIKNFIDKIMMGKRNPMNVKYYSYKVEFQARGAGHVHGTLWLDMNKVEMLHRSEEGGLRNPTSKEKNMWSITCDEDTVVLNQCTTNKEISDHISSSQIPLCGLKNVFRKLKANERLTHTDQCRLKTFIDEFTTVCTNEQTVGTNVAKIAKEVNKHHHTKTCRKYNEDCRFDYPRCPTPHTIIAQPLSDDYDAKERDVILTKNKNIIEKVKDILVVDGKPNEINQKLLEGYDIETESPEEYKANREKRIKAMCKEAKVDYDEYIEALSKTRVGVKIHQARDINEVFSNSYNVEWLEAWDGNLDIQVTLDYYQVITYIADYLNKMSELIGVINAVLAKQETKNVKEEMRSVANQFLTHRQMGEAEAIFRLSPAMTLKKSNVKCQWISLGEKEDRASRWKKLTEEQLQKGLDGVALEEHEGFWYEQQDMLSKYRRRPDILKDICLAQFSKIYQSYSNKKAMEKLNEDEDEDPNENEVPVQEDEDDIEQILKYIVTHQTDYEKTKLPKIIPIQNPNPGEARLMKLRAYPAAIRYNKSSRHDNPLSYMLKELMLYRPHREDSDFNEIEVLYNERYNGKRKIEIIKEIVMPHLEGIEEARYYVEQMKEDVDIEVTGAEFDAMGEQENAECADIPEQEHPNYEQLDPGELREDEPANNVYRNIEIPTDTVLREKTQMLDMFQKQVINEGIKYAKKIVKARKDGNKYPTAPLMMISGGAGAGKSTVINTLAEWFQKIVQKEGDDMECQCVIKTSFTGTASSNIDGTTLHSAFGFSFDNTHYPLNDKKRHEKRKQMKNLKLLIIDEVSMVKADMIYSIDLRLQEITENHNQPFGNIAVFLFGDLCQLKPCMGHYPHDITKNDEFHATYHIHPRWKMFKSLILEKNHRQGADKEYAELLNRMRVGEMTNGDKKTLIKRMRSDGHEDIKNCNLYIVCTRKEAAKHNIQYLAGLPGDLITAHAIHHNPTQKKYKPKIEKKDGTVANTGFMDVLHMKLNAKVILIHNISVADSLTNGQLGILIAVIRKKENEGEGDVSKLIVKLTNPKAGRENMRRNKLVLMRYPGCVVIERVTDSYTIRKNTGEVAASASVIQFPIKLAAAITAHKIQGQSILKPLTVALHIESVFEPGQAYVMFSRVQALEQVFIIGNPSFQKIKPSHLALSEVRRLEEISWNKNPGNWYKTPMDCLKVASLNCRGLQTHYDDISGDYVLLQADIIHLVETSLENDNMEPYGIRSYRNESIIVKKGRGITTYVKDNLLVNVTVESKTGMQIIKISQRDIDCISVYRSQNGDEDVLLKTINEMINSEKATIVTGDMNICYNARRHSKFVQGMERTGFTQYVSESTHISGGLIDHIYWKNQKKSWEIQEIEQYTPYYSDHDALLVVLKKV